jgi:hypothetical protein
MASGLGDTCPWGINLHFVGYRHHLFDRLVISTGQNETLGDKPGIEINIGGKHPDRVLVSPFDAN